MPDKILMKRVDLTQAYTPAYILIIIILSILAVFLMYGIFNDYIVTVFPEMVLENGGSEGWATFTVDVWQTWFPVAFVISLIIFVIINAQRREE